MESRAVLLVRSGLMALALSSCAGLWPNPVRPIPPGPSDADGRDPSCGGASFPVSLLDGPQVTRALFLTTPMGWFLEDLFTSGQEVESDMFEAAEGFSVVSDSYVLGYQDSLPAFDFYIEGNRVVAWGECGLRWTWHDLDTGAWELQVPVSEESTLIPIAIQGETCGEEVITEVAAVEVVESAERVEITAWTRETWAGTPICIGVGARVNGVVVLKAPLGHRTLIDGGFIPGREVDRS